MDPTPPPAPITSMHCPTPPRSAIFSRSNSSSHAVMAVKGSAAALAAPSAVGRLLAIRLYEARAHLPEPAPLHKPAVGVDHGQAVNSAYRMENHCN